MALEQLKTMTIVVADTGDFESELSYSFFQMLIYGMDVDLHVHVFPSLYNKLLSWKLNISATVKSLIGKNLNIVFQF